MTGTLDKIRADFLRLAKDTHRNGDVEVLDAALTIALAMVARAVAIASWAEGKSASSAPTRPLSPLGDRDG